LVLVNVSNDRHKALYLLDKIGIGGPSWNAAGAD